ncbi:glycosyl hydrolase [Paenibacillus sp. SAF-054]|uniref:glycosyl hydrolase n=1 Tax=unclassified Paenibacillus TaxID=185978 RepID=UPI003F7E8CFD
MNRHRASRWLAGLLLVSAAGFWLYKEVRPHQPSPLQTEAFIKQYMTNTNGTLATYLQSGKASDPEIAAGREALSESLGFWMQHTLIQQDRGSFRQNFAILKEYFVTPQHYVAWKLEPDGTSGMHTNALGDDLRIIGALIEAGRLWEEPDVAGMAELLTKTLISSAQVNGYLTDFHDFANRTSAQTLSLAYIDSDALMQMRDARLIDEPFFGRMMQVLANMPDDGSFYPKSFNVMTGQYKYEHSVNLIDQLLVGIHAAESGRRPEPLLSFLKKEWERGHKLYGQYDRTSRSKSVDYESPSVYGLAVQLALQNGDTAWAKELYRHLLTLRDGDSQYPGGYVFSNNTHIFDNLLPLIAGECVQNISQK